MLKGMSVMHPAAKMLVDLSAAQDVEAGDGTTSVVVIAGSLLGAADRLLAKGRLSRQFPSFVLTGLRHTSHRHFGIFPTSCGSGSGNIDRDVSPNIIVRQKNAITSSIDIFILQDCITALKFIRSHCR